MSALALSNTGFRPLPVAGFNVPREWVADQVLLVAASPKWVDLDFAAVVASRYRIKRLFGPSDDWPPNDLDKLEDRDDLEWHAREFELGRSFAYHLLSQDRRRCLGCLYIYPTASHCHDAEAYLWTHARLERRQAAMIEDNVIDWVTHDWPFEAVAWPGRFIPFTRWVRAAIPNYYAHARHTTESLVMED